MLISWVFISLDKINESTENPFEGNVQHVPISQIGRAIEIDQKEMLDDDELPKVLKTRNKITL
ncbi:hypothetical protein ASG22_00985 [Chryseobacterium sp. Leaf405]|uniref:hypothetical protein n=1 Tax=Chryseobacterium sp. Leaf405 TaxID=1736367 RepID=UPI0006FD7157|nr:hypothetical protein [Chryseobacterium sp. Leaf405]KQT35631.1 hypothetical protein ASG22_00985 [Chryseobacterium sp. Leaf405]